MPSTYIPSLSSCPVEEVAPGTVLLRRAQVSDSVLFIDSGEVVLGLLGLTPPPPDTPVESILEYQLGTVTGPAWLESTAAVLNQAQAVDAVALTPLRVRRLPLSEFQSAVNEGPQAVRAILRDLARMHRQQTLLAVSRLAKDAQSRCAEWLLSQSKSNDKGGCMVQLQQRKRLIAAQLGITPETLSRTLRHLRERSLISGTGRTVQLTDPGALRALAGV